MSSLLSKVGPLLRAMQLHPPAVSHRPARLWGWILHPHLKLNRPKTTCPPNWMLNEVFQDAQSQHDMSPPRLSPVADNGKAPDVDSPPDGGQAVATPQGRAAIPAPKGSLVSKGHLKPKSAGKPPSKFDKYYHQKLWLRYLWTNCCSNSNIQIT